MFDGTIKIMTYYTEKVKHLFLSCWQHLKDHRNIHQHRSNDYNIVQCWTCQSDHSMRSENYMHTQLTVIPYSAYAYCTQVYVAK